MREEYGGLGLEVQGRGKRRTLGPTERVGWVWSAERS
jgi:hypothetical protein